MLRSFYSGISGLRNFQTKLDVVSNNIANVNTVAFKASRVVFQDIMSQTLAGATAPTDNLGGVNPRQIGLGATISSIDTKFNQDSPQMTNYPTDLYINGDGFFVVEDSAGNRYLTRAGNFRFDTNGYLVTAEGYFVLGVSQDGRVMQRIKLDDMTTSFRIDQNGNIIESPRVNEPMEKGITVGTTDGNTAVFIIPFNTDRPITFDLENDQYDKFVVYLNGQPAENFGFQYKIEDQNGNLVVRFIDNNGNDDPPEVGYTITIDYPTGEVGTRVIEDPNSGTYVYTMKNIPLDENNGGLKVEVYTISNSSNGYYDKKMVEGTDYTVDYTNGKITFNIDPTNGGQNQFVVRYVYQLASEQTYTIHTVVVDNPAGLEKIGGNLYMLTTNADRNPNLLFELTAENVANNLGAGSIWAGYLEMSNVDLAEEFTEMIIAQRGFQANSRIITTSDEVLQELVNLKR